jgi:hypothetical protein
MVNEKAREVKKIKIKIKTPRIHTSGVKEAYVRVTEIIR